MFFQGRGNVWLSQRNSEGITGPAVMICTDTLAIALATDSFEHINKCGPVDTPDYRGSRSSTGTVTMSFVDVAERNFAIGVLGVVNGAQLAGTVTAELLPAGLVAGDVYFLGGVERHRAITALVVKDSDSPQTTLTVATHYTLDAATGKLTIVNPAAFTQPFEVAYGHTDPASVAILAAGTPEYFLSYENINKAENNDPGAVELYRVRFDPASTIDLQSDELQSLELTGTVLADSTKLVTDTELGQFGRRIL